MKTEIKFEVKKAKLGSSIKTYNSRGKELFLTVESLDGDIGLFKGCKLIAKCKRLEYENTSYFTYSNKNYIIKKDMK